MLFRPHEHGYFWPSSRFSPKLPEAGLFRVIPSIFFRGPCIKTAITHNIFRFVFCWYLLSFHYLISMYYKTDISLSLPIFMHYSSFSRATNAETTDYGRSMKPFFIEISNFWAWADNLI